MEKSATFSYTFKKKEECPSQRYVKNYQNTQYRNSENGNV